MSPIRRLQVAGLVLLAFSAGCNFARSCTLIGCVNGLFVEFSQPTPGPFRVEVRGTSSMTVHVYECTSATGCGQGLAMFEDYFPQSVTIKLTTAAGTTTMSATPVYTESQPNGKGCGPTCRSARVTVPAPTG